MSIRHLDSLFSPRSVAVIGASDRLHSVGHTVWSNLTAGYKGELHAVNIDPMALGGKPVFPDLQSLAAQCGKGPELAVICTPATAVPGLITELGALGTRAAVVISAGLTPAQKQAMLEATRCASWDLTVSACWCRTWA
ncbi:MAG: hypothetical protein RIS48_1403 [Pseudomonadota bacterium]